MFKKVTFTSFVGKVCARIKNVFGRISLLISGEIGKILDLVIFFELVLKSVFS